MRELATRRGAVSAMAALGLAIIGFVALSGLAVIGEEVTRPATRTLAPNYSECMLFAAEGRQFRLSPRDRFALSTLTQQVQNRMERTTPATKASTGPRPRSAESYSNTIDKEIFGALEKAGVAPAQRTTDLEFIRRVSLDLTGRVPRPDRAAEFVGDPNPAKREALVDQLLDSPEYVDKWTMYFGDLYKNNLVNQQIARFAEGRNAFNRWIKQAVESNKPYNQMTTELIASNGTNSFVQGEVNWLVGGYVAGSPVGGQDIYDQQAANVAETFLGISHENCILCHDGRRHLDAMSVWGKQETRYKAWQMAAFFAKTVMPRTVSPTALSPNAAYFGLTDNRGFPDYPLDTTTGNRPTRARIGAITNVTPEYPFTGQKPAPNENYRVALARFVTADPQFARHIVNLMWKELFGRGIIDPVNQVDPLRLEESTLPTENPDTPRLSTLQPSHPQLLKSLGAEFQADGYRVKQLLRKMVLSEAYQLSSRYDGVWKAEYEPLFARKFVRRLWGEEIMDALIQVSNVPLALAVTTSAADNVSWAMQLPEPVGMPRAANTASFLDSFLRGNRDNEARRADGNIAQVLNLMNDTIVYTRARASGAGATASLARQLLDRYAEPATNNALLQQMFLTVLARGPNTNELTVALNRMGQLTGTARQQAVEDVLWALYNKVDFLYNY